MIYIKKKYKTRCCIRTDFLRFPAIKIAVIVTTFRQLLDKVQPLYISNLDRMVARFRYLLVVVSYIWIFPQ